MEDPGVGVAVGGAARRAVRAFDAHFAEDVDDTCAQARAEGGRARLAGLQAQDRTAVTVLVAGAGDQGAPAEGVRRISAEDERDLSVAGVGHAEHQRVTGAGQLGAGRRRVQRQAVGAAADQELRAAGAPRGEGRGRKRAAGVGPEVPVAAAEGRHVRRGREGGAIVEGEHAGARAGHREAVEEVVERRLSGRGADAERREVEGARGAGLERGAAEVGDGTQAEGGPRVDDHGGAGGAERRGVLVDAHRALLEVEATGPPAARGVMVEVEEPDAALGQTARTLQDVAEEEVGGLIGQQRAVADHQLALEIEIIAEGVGVEAQLRAVHRADAVRAGVRAEGAVGGGRAAVAVGDEGDRAADDEVLAGGGEVSAGVVGRRAQGAVVEEVVAEAEDVVVGVAEAAELAAHEGDRRRQRRVVAAEA